MTYCLGCDLGATSTTWSRLPVGDDGPAPADGSVASSVGLTEEGALRVAEPGSSGLTDVTSGFVGSLGDSEPIIVGGTPYGPEALVGSVLAEVVAVNVAATGSEPAKFALVHDDDLDPYRLSLLTEAARTAGISGELLVLVPRSQAEAESDDGAGAVGGSARGAAAVAASGLPPSAGGAGGAAGISGATAAGAGAAGAAGGAAAAAGTAAATGTAGTAAATGAAGAAGVAAAEGGAVAGAAAAAAGPLGAAVGPAGAAGIAGPAGAVAGPAGAAVGPAGAGAAGAAGPAGAGLSASGAVTGGAIAAKSSLPWIPIALVGGAVAVILGVVGVAVLAGGGDDDPEAEAVVTTVPAEVVVTDPITTEGETEPVEPVDTEAVESTVPEETVAESTVPADDAGELSAFEGTWGLCISEEGVSADIEYVISATGPAALNLAFTASGGEGGCGTGGVVVQQSTNVLTVDTINADGGATTITGQSDEGPFTMIAEGDTLTVIPPTGGESIVLTRS